MRRTTRFIPLIPLALGALLASAAPATAEPAERHCSVTVVGQKASGELVTTPMVCRSTPSEPRMSAASTALAFHYTGLNHSGSSYAVYGSACSWGWIDFPAGWQDVISSTWSLCTVDHFDLASLAGTSESIPGSGNLTHMDNRTNSARYR
jgi:hypothetical protein